MTQADKYKGKDKGKHKGKDKGKDKGKFQETIDNCKKQTNATEADVEVIKNHQIPKTREAKCLLACTHTALGFVC